MSKSKWIKINGELPHSCNLPSFIDSISGPGATQLQKRHLGSVWQCKCKIKYEWSGKKWVMP